MADPAPPSIWLDAEVDGDTALIAVRGEMDHASSVRLRTRVAELIEGGSRHLVLDLTDLEFMDSGGIAAVAHLYQQAQAVDGSLALRSCTPMVRRLLAVSGLDRFVAVEPATGAP